MLNNINKIHKIHKTNQSTQPTLVGLLYLSNVYMYYSLSINYNEREGSYVIYGY